MKKTKIEININNFPSQIHYLFNNATVYDSSCSSEAAVYYLDTGYYIKTAARHTLAREAKLSRLFYERGFGVEVIDYISTDKDYLVTRSAVGEDLTHDIHEPEKLCQILATALRDLHTQPITDVPISRKYQYYMERANANFDDGSYDYFVAVERFYVKNKEEAWKLMQSGKKLLKNDTLIHGDACLPNVLQYKDRFSTFIDFDMAGLGDKHIDLFWAVWSLQYNLKTDAYTDLFLDLYGRENFDEDMLRVIAAFELFG